MSRPNRQTQKEETRKLLLQTAYAVFSERGIMNTRMSDIAQSAGVSHGTLFVHFSTQQSLITEVVEEYGRRIALRTHELSASCEDLREILSAHLRGIREFEPFYTRLVLENRFLPEAARDAWIAIQSAVSFHFSQVMTREPREAGATGVPTHMLFNTWLGLVHYYLTNGDLFAPEGNVIDRYGDAMIDTYMKLIRG